MKSAQGNWVRRLDADLKRDLQDKLIQHARELLQRLQQSTGGHRTTASRSPHLATDATANPNVANSQASELPYSSASATAGSASSSTEHTATGKKSQEHKSAPRKRAATTSHGTEQTEAAAMTVTTEPNEQQGHAATEHVSPELETNAGSTPEQTSLPVINSLDDILASFGPQGGEEEACRTLHLAAQTLKKAKRDPIRKLCKPWDVTGQQTTESMYRR